MDHPVIPRYILCLLFFAAGPAQAAPVRIPFYTDGPAARKAVSITFDDGPGPFTERILGVLAAQGVTASFFMAGGAAQSRSGVARAVAKAGHEVGNHTAHHVNFFAYRGADRAAALVREVSDGEQMIFSATGLRPRLLRLPHGMSRSWAREALAGSDRILINWSFGCDWNKMSADEMFDGYVKAIRPGAIFLMHDGGKDRSRTIAVLERLIPEIKGRGYEILPVGRLLGVSSQDREGRGH